MSQTLPSDAEKARQLLVAAIALLPEEASTTPLEHAKIALFMVLRARLGYERISLYPSTLLSSSGQQIASPRVVLKIDDQFVCEWGVGDWGDYPTLALRRARIVFKKKARCVETGSAPVKLEQIIEWGIDPNIVRSVDQQSTSYFNAVPRAAKALEPRSPNA